MVGEKKTRSGGMAEQLGTLLTLSEDLVWFLSFKLPVHSSQDALMASSELHGHLYTDIHIHT